MSRTPKGPRLESEALHQAEADRFEVGPSIQATLFESKFKNSSKSETGDASAGAQLEYGLNENFSVGFSLGYLSEHVEDTAADGSTSSSSLRGITDPEVALKGRYNTGSGVLHYGLVLTSSIEKSKTDSSGVSNAASGGTVVAPFVGYDMPLSYGMLVGKISYDLYSSDRSIEDDSGGTSQSYKNRPGKETTLGVFYEAPVIPLLTIGGGLNYLSHPESSSDLSGTMKGNGDNYSAVGLEVYVPFYLPSEIVLIPTISYASYSFDSSAWHDSMYSISESFVARFTF